MSNSPIRQSDNSLIPLADESVGIAPGRLDVMGGIADYSGSLLLEIPIAERTEVRLIPRNDGMISARSDGEEESFTIHKIEIAGIPYRELGKMLKQRSGGHWATYVVGCLVLLEQEKGIYHNGVDFVVRSLVPAGKGVSSSAALEVAAMHAIVKSAGLSIDPLDLAVLAQKVENLVVGASCGLMDQLAVNLGKKDHLLPIVCQPHEVFDPLPIPEGIRFYGLDSGVRHAVSGASYGDVRTAAFMGFTLAMLRSGKSREDLMGAGLPFGGFLANIDPAVFLDTYAGLIPEQMTGADFLEECGIHIDPVTTIDPSGTYYPRRAALHPVMENHRIGKFRAGLESFARARDQEALSAQLGQWMLESHKGYESVGLGEPVTSRIVELIMTRGRGHGIPGARISGGGSGGTVAVMVTSNEGLDLLMDIKAEMEKSTGKELKLFEDSSDGAHYIN